MTTPIANRRVGPFNAVEVGAPDAELTIVLFHGYGASGSDLAPLSAEMPLKIPVHWVFPDAPLRADSGGLAWFPIDVEAIEKAQESGVAADFSRSEPPELQKTAQAAEEFIKELRVPWDRLILGGFSQGAMLAVELALGHEEPPAGLVILSGNLIREKAWSKKAPRRRGLRFFQSHGIADPILGFRGAARLHDLLTRAGLRGAFLKFEDGHAISPEVLASLGPWMDQLARTERI